MPSHLFFVALLPEMRLPFEVTCIPAQWPSIARVPGLKSFHSAAVRGYGDGGAGAAGIHHRQALAGVDAPQASAVLLTTTCLGIGPAVDPDGVARDWRRRWRPGLRL